MATKPDMTAQWEATLNAISEKQTSYQNFMQPLMVTLQEMVELSGQQNFDNLPKTPFKFAKKTFKKSRRSKKTA